ncbi:MAG: gamma-glutamyl-gamma-aminobutyrate hydrolase family protein [Thermoanaerobaculia bacterium]
MPRIVVSYIKEDRVDPYLEALALVGVPESDLLRATPMRVADVDLGDWMRQADGLLLTGGADLQPCLYGEGRNPAAHLDPPAADRDQMEWDLLSLAREQRVPVFGICRGHQTLNVFLGGALMQDIALETGRTGHDCFVDAGWEPGHLAHEVVPARNAHPLTAAFARYLRPLVNSRHHQAVKRIGNSLVLAATAPDGIIEATASEIGAGWWLQSVQWHPENLMEMDVHRELFERFILAARERSARKGGANLKAPHGRGVESSAVTEEAGIRG